MLSVVYDKDIMEKVFQLRDSERYTNSTQTTLEMTYNNNRSDYVTANFTATVKKHLGRGSIAFYCDNELVAVQNCNQGTETITASAKVSYGYHTYYAKYLGNAECLSSKSGVVELSITEPNLPKTIVGLSVVDLDSNSWIDALPNMILTLKNADDNTAITGKDIKIYVNDDEPITYTLTGSSASIKSLLSDYNNYIGQMKVRVEFEGDVEYLGNEAETTFYVGYDLNATPKYTKIGVGDTVTIDVLLSKPNGEPVADKSIKLNG